MKLHRNEGAEFFVDDVELYNVAMKSSASTRLRPAEVRRTSQRQKYPSVIPGARSVAYVDSLSARYAESSCMDLTVALYSRWQRTSHVII